MSASDTNTAVRHKSTLKPPSRWNVVILNDDTTPMDYVIHVLQDEYNHSPPTAEKIMLSVHHEGRGIAGTFSHQIAEQKSKDTMARAQQRGYGLQVQIQREG